MASRKRNVEIDVVVDDAKARSQLKGLSDTAVKTGSGFSNMAKMATVGIGAIVGTGLVNFLKDAATAAAEDERAQRLLALAIKNTVGATDEQIAATEEWIDQTARATGVADDQLRPALAELVRTHGSLSEATDALGVAMDISAAKGLSLETVSIAMGKAALGNVGALGRLGIATRNADGDMLTYEETLAEAARTMGGATAEAASTAEGALRRFNVAVSEGQEEIGGALIPILADAAEFGLDAATIFQFAADKLKEIGDEAGDTEDEGRSLIENFFHWSGWGAFIEATGNVADRVGSASEATQDWGESSLNVIDPTQDLTTATEELADATFDLAAAVKEVVGEQMAAVSPAYAAFRSARNLQEATENVNEAIQKHGENSQEAADAVMKYVEAELEADATAQLFAQNGGVASIEAFRKMATEAGISREAIQFVIDTILQLNRTPITTRFPSSPSMGGVGSTRDGTLRFHDGGVVPGMRGQEQLAIVKGGETVLPTHDPSFSLTTNSRGGGTVNYVTVTDPSSRLIRELIELDRRS